MSSISSLIILKLNWYYRTCEWICSNKTYRNRQQTRLGPQVRHCRPLIYLVDNQYKHQLQAVSEMLAWIGFLCWSGTLEKPKILLVNQGAVMALV